jgi:hypothetical protein
LNKRDKFLETAQIKYLRLLLGFTKLDHESNTDVWERLQVENIVEDKRDYQENYKRTYIKNAEIQINKFSL